MDNTFPPQFPALVSASSLDNLIYASYLCDSPTELFDSSNSSPESLPFHSAVSKLPPLAALDLNLLKGTMSSGSDSPPPVPPKDWPPMGRKKKNGGSSRQRSASLGRGRSAQTSSPGAPGSSSGHTSTGRSPTPSSSTRRPRPTRSATVTNAEDLDGLFPIQTDAPLRTPPLNTPPLTTESTPDTNSPRDTQWTTTLAYYSDSANQGTIGDAEPYMVSHSAAARTSDYYTTELLLQLTPNGSPTFWDYGKTKRPTNVLDLGCGEGYWAAHTALAWKEYGTRVTAFDLVDPGSTLRPILEDLDPEVAGRIRWETGNFVSCNLPYKSGTFDFVRMANLSLAIPHERWPSLLQDVRRVLKWGGRLEIIDDQLFFPKVQWPFEWDKVPGQPTSPDKDDYPEHLPVPAPFAEFKEDVWAAGFLENNFEEMILKKYKMYPRPHMYIQSALRSVFVRPGMNNYPKDVKVVDKLATFRLSVPSAPPPARPNTTRRSTEETKLPGLPITIEWERKDKDKASWGSLSSKSAIPFPTSLDSAPSMPTKAAKMLLGRKDMNIRALKPHQPDGLLVSPGGRFIPCKPEVLEAHACRNMDILLACQYSLRTWLFERGMPLTKKKYEDMMWEYACFKRRRMNWPAQTANTWFDEKEEDDEAHEPLHQIPLRRPSNLPSTTPGLFRRRTESDSMAAFLAKKAMSEKEGTDVRHIRVFTAVKVPAPGECP
ncbi:S-adenosyl-L-methionine-dependent methyltransferase [Panus rudis PR-1116 ss-1]|nr:S-adenosyl-L-methionine-dependent methyltransferase [Panus rudis PR-1116 ss-1]